MTNEPAKYIHGHSAAVLKAHGRRTAGRDAAYLLPHLQPHFSILDIGCGPGTISADLASLVPDGQVTCLEVSETALAAARRTFADRAITNVAFASGDVTARLPFPDEAFDVVHAHMVLIHLADPITALREMRRVLRPGGVLASKDAIMSSLVWYPSDPRLGTWQHGITGTIAPTGADPDMGSRLKAAALEAGFPEESLRSVASCWSFTTREDVEFWGESCAARLEEGSELRGKIVAGRYATDEEVDGFVAASREWTTKPGAWFASLNGELLAWK
jgi:SAM-dependent methyltransferase